jgi:hypothetical protein
LTADELDKIDRDNGLVWASKDHERHMPEYHMKDRWDEVVRRTNGPEPIAKYKHTLTEIDVHRLEQDCLLGSQRQTTKADGRSRVAWCRCGDVIGASDGKETDCFRVEVTSGCYHGYPITERAGEQESPACVWR